MISKDPLSVILLGTPFAPLAMGLATIKMPVGEDGLGSRQVHLTHLTAHHVFHLGGAGASIFALALIAALGGLVKQVNTQTEE